jgi:hypothetical protein
VSAFQKQLRNCIQFLLKPFDSREPSRCTVVVKSRLYSVWFDIDGAPSIASVELRAQLFPADRVRANIGALVTEAEYVNSSIALGHRRETRYVTWSLVIVERMEQPAVEHRLEPASQPLQRKRVSDNELDVDPTVDGLLSRNRQSASAKCQRRPLVVGLAIIVISNMLTDVGAQSAPCHG